VDSGMSKVRSPHGNTGGKRGGDPPLLDSLLPLRPVPFALRLNI